MTGATSGRLVAVQVKTRNTGSYTGETKAGFEYLMDETDVAYWKGCNLPVVVVLVHLERNQAYWKSVDTGEGSSGRRLRIDKTKDIFDAGARDAIEVILPEYIYVAASPFTNGRQALHELLIHEERPPDDWIIRGGQFMSFRDLRQSSLLHIVDPGAVEPIASEEIAFPDDEAEERNMIELLRRTLGAQLDGVLAYSRDQRAFHFPAVHDTIERSYPYRPLKNWTSADVVKKYEKDGKLKYVRHHAFEPRFWRIDDQWFLSVTPDIRFHVGRVPAGQICKWAAGWQEAARTQLGSGRAMSVSCGSSPSRRLACRAACLMICGAPANRKCPKTPARGGLRYEHHTSAP